MTVTSIDHSTDFTAAGTAGGGEQFVFTYEFTVDTEIKVFTTAAGVITDLLFGTEYTVIPVLGSETGGTVTVSKVLTAGDTVTVQRFVSPTQPTNFSGTGPLDVESVEKQEDRAAMMVQQLHERTGGSTFSSSEDRRIAGKTGSTTDWDAKTGKIADVVDPTVDQEAATKKYVDDQISAASITDVPNPVGGEEGFVLRADEVTIGDYSWDSIGEALQPVAADVDRALVATGLDTFAFQDTFKGNFILNSGFRIPQRGTTFDATTTPANDDDTYLLDQWILLSDGNDRADITQELSVIPTDGFSAIKFEVETVGSPSEKMGILEILEARDSRRLWKDDLTGVVSLSFKARTTSSQVENLRAAVAVWTSTEDAPTSDLVNVWGAEGTNPTTIANWVFENTPANLGLTNAYQTFKIENIALDNASTANIAIFIWTDDTDLVANDVFYITDVQLEPGPTAHPYVQKPFQQELDLCRRFYAKTFALATAPAQSAGLGGALGINAAGQQAAADDGDFTISWRFPVEMFGTTPTITTFNPSAANANARNEDDSTNTPVTVSNIVTSGCMIRPSPIVAADTGDRMSIHASAESVL